MQTVKTNLGVWASGDKGEELRVESLGAFREDGYILIPTADFQQ